MKSWKNQWKAELDKSTPKLRADVSAAPINAVESKPNTAVSAPLAKRKPFWYALSSAVAFALIVVVLCSTLIPSGGGNVYAFVVEINPAVTISADGKGNVTGIVASNTDADVILSDVDAVQGLKGKPVDEAVKWYVDKAAKLGYLDADGASAIRVSATDNADKLLSKVSDSLESYFMSNGIRSFVVTDLLDVKAFAERADLQVSDSIKAITDYVQSAEPISRNRMAKDLSADELKQTYKNYVASDYFATGVGDYLNGIIDTVVQNEKDLYALIALNEQIESSADNPASILTDYWSVKTFYKDYTAEFGELMSRMDKAVADYNSTYGKDVTDKISLITVSGTYSVISAEKLQAVLQHFTADYFKLHIDMLSDIIQTVSLDTPLVGLTTMPETVTEFVDKVRDVVAIEYASREKQFEDIYNKVRDQISQSDYADFKQELLDKYGSANGVWNNLK